MATVTLSVRTSANTYRQDFEIDKLSFTRSIVRQGRGARAAWRCQFSHSRFELIPQSHEVLKWNVRRAEHYARSRDAFTGAPTPLHGIRAAHRALKGDPWAMIDGPPSTELPSPRPLILFGDEQAAPGSDDD